MEGNNRAPNYGNLDITHSGDSFTGLSGTTDEEPDSVFVSVLIRGEYDDKVIADLEALGYEVYPDPVGRAVWQPIDTIT